MKIQEFIASHIKKRLDDRKALLVYDPKGLYRKIVMDLADESVTVVDAGKSTIFGREAALNAWCRLGQNDDENFRLIIYLPTRKPFTERELQDNPYQIFALGGGEFPEGDGESYQALCRQAAPDLGPQIDQLFAAGVPEFETVNNLIAGGATWPKLKTLLKAESAAEILTAVMSPSDEQEKALLADQAWVAEFKQFLSAVLDCRLKTKSTKLPTITSELWRYVLFSEFNFDLPGSLPEALKDVPRAADHFSNLVYNVCENLRSSDRHQQQYMEMAEKVASELKLESHLAGVSDLGKRDTFAFEERFYLKVFVDAVFAGNYERAAEIRDHRNRSIWVRHKGERQQLWTVANRALLLLIACEDLKPDVDKIGATANTIFEFYCERFRRIDRLHRDFEQAVTDAFGELDVLEKVVDSARHSYLQVAEALQRQFTAVVKKEGWPVSGLVRRGRSLIGLSHLGSMNAEKLLFLW